MAELSALDEAKQDHIVEKVVSKSFKGAKLQ